jgi:hypothetical protein
MQNSDADRFIRRSQSIALVALPSLLILVFVLHFRTLGDFFILHTRYAPTPSAVIVPRLIAGANRQPLVHDPHIIGYLVLPLFPLCALGLFRLGKTHRQILAMVGLCCSMVGTVYLGGLFGMWTAFFRGIGNVDPRFTEGAIATFAAMTKPEGAFLLTTQLAKTAMLGFALQALALWGRARIPRWSVASIAIGCGLFLAFWDIDNLMLVAAVLLLAGFHACRPAIAAAP